MDMKTTYPKLPNGDNENNSRNNPAKWYLFKIPVKQYNRTVGAISGLQEYSLYAYVYDAIL